MAKQKPEHPSTLAEAMAELPVIDPSEASMSPTNLPDGQTNKDD